VKPPYDQVEGEVLYGPVTLPDGSMSKIDLPYAVRYPKGSKLYPEGKTIDLAKARQAVRRP